MGKPIVAILLLCISAALGAQTISVDASHKEGPVKLLNGVNGGPARSRPFAKEMFKAARVPLSRTHDLADKYDFGNFPYEMNTDSRGTEITVKFDRRSFAYIELR